MSFIKGTPRSDVLLFPEALDDYVSTDNPVRFIEAFVNNLDLLKLGFSRTTPADTGRPAYDPADLLKLYIYGYINRTRSSRLLEKESHRNLEVIWLMRKLRPDFKTISDFRKDNAEAIKKVCREFTLLCKRLELFGGELIAIDGSKFKAQNSKSRNFTDKKLDRAIKEIDKKIQSYLDELDEADEQEADVTTPTAEQLKEKIEELRNRRGKHEQTREQLKQSGHTQISLTDPDSRSMKVSQGTDVCYNVQTVVDSKHKLIVEHEVTNDPTDQAQLSKMALRAKQVLGVEGLEVVADRGYYDGAEVKRCEQEGVTVYVAKQQTSANRKRGLFTKEDFRYDSQKDCYVCPAGKELSYRCETVELGRQIRYYSTNECRRCEIKSQCTRNKRVRRISRWVDEEILERMGERVRASPEKMKKRKELVEHPYGTMKRGMNSGYFLMRGIKKVAAEMSLTVLGYNIKRVINILGVRKMIEAVA
ncbi:MAG TPA: IS1182 family transposase [Candidatus Saccharimonadales bacterium]|nr:IS1182 family transposase [Candidatus Saccharimonadales bacterium]